MNMPQLLFFGRIHGLIFPLCFRSSSLLLCQYPQHPFQMSSDESLSRRSSFASDQDLEDFFNLETWNPEENESTISPPRTNRMDISINTLDSNVSGISRPTDLSHGQSCNQFTHVMCTEDTTDMNLTLEGDEAARATSDQVHPANDSMEHSQSRDFSFSVEIEEDDEQSPIVPRHLLLSSQSTQVNGQENISTNDDAQASQETHHDSERSDGDRSSGVDPRLPISEVEIFDNNRYEQDTYEPATTGNEYLVDDTLFPAPLEVEMEGDHLLGLVRAKFDVDSIYLISKRPSLALLAVAKSGTLKYQTSLNRIHNNNSSRVSINYHGAQDLRPRVHAKRLRRLNVIALHHFPNINLATLTVGDITFHFGLHILQPSAIGNSNYITHPVLLTLIAALNIAIDGDLTGNFDEETDEMLENWRRTLMKLELPYFELQSGSANQRTKLHSYAKTLTLRHGVGLFRRFEHVLSVMSDSPENIDCQRQIEYGTQSYWKERMGISYGGSGEVVPVSHLKAHATLLRNKSLYLISSAGTKNYFKIPGRLKWEGPLQAQYAQLRGSHIEELYREFHDQEFSKVMEEMETWFPFLSHRTCQLFKEVKLFFDLGLEVTPITEEYVLLSNVTKSKNLLRQIVSSRNRGYRRLRPPGSPTDHSRQRTRSGQTAMTEIGPDENQDEAPQAPAHDDHPNLLLANPDEEESDEESYESTDTSSDGSGDPLDDLSYVPGRSDVSEEWEYTHMVPSESDANSETSEASEADADEDPLYDFFDGLVEKAQQQFTAYPKRFSRIFGNVHSGHIKLNPIPRPSTMETNEDLAIPEEVVVDLAIPSPSFVRGGQIYDPSLRLEVMNQQRPLSSHHSGIVTQTINICQGGNYLPGVTVAESMKMVQPMLQGICEVFQHRRHRRDQGIHSRIRIELFVSSNNQGRKVRQLPRFDPTEHLQLFSRPHVDDYEESVISTHLNPCVKLMGNFEEMLAANQVINLDALSPQGRTRLIGSLEVLSNFLDDYHGISGTILKNIKLHDRGITTTLPPSEWQPLTQAEIELTGFHYGLNPQLLPLVRNPNIPRHFGHVPQQNGKHQFPPSFSAIDRSIASGLHPSLNVADLASVKAMATHVLLSCCKERTPDVSPSPNSGGTSPEPPAFFGLMESPSYHYLSRLATDRRKRLLQDLAKILLASYCQATWTDLVNMKVFGDTPTMPDPDGGEPIDVTESLQWCPFTAQKVTHLTTHISGTKFVQKTVISSTGELVYAICWFFNWGTRLPPVPH